MSSTYGENLKLTIFGQSHGAAIGMTLDGIPAGLPVDFEELQVFLNRRAPVSSSTAAAACSRAAPCARASRTAKPQASPSSIMASPSA